MAQAEDVKRVEAQTGNTIDANARIINVKSPVDPTDAVTKAYADVAVKGDTGDTGAVGAKGDTGDKGDPGTNFTQLGTTARQALTPTAGEFIYDTDLNKLCFYNGAAWEIVTSTVEV